MCQHDFLAPLLEAGTYAVDEQPSGPPRRPSFGEPGAVVLAPGDARGLVLIPDRLDGYCLGLTGCGGPNLACAGCGQPVAIRVDDCSYWQTTSLLPSAVHRMPVPGPVRAPVPWEVLGDAYEAWPPVEPIGWWDARWRAAIGAALAHLLVASEGAAVALPPGLLTTVLGPALAGLLPPGPPTKTLTLSLAGPGLSSPGRAPDLALVPRHPQTGEVWAPPSRPGEPAGTPVPLAAEVWLHLACGRDPSRLPVTGGLPPGVERDDPLPRHPAWVFHPDWTVFHHTLTRLPKARTPWLLALAERMAERPFLRPF
ncbi:hypothetical protein [Streptacidiphilus jiangxiensis]|uniref:Uncharacterized protein n=1 Tax=Streptacidiphilus jiangxiensis TaxID=235985 RepID=A0A1H7Y738_STRJI|nr:hypothetical protein [Streptacidiphilus jiangxiensis]SEM41735.1 hypothetical protein SAMN05414137_12724 [Streptacidiphilus jiangxiensis]